MERIIRSIVDNVLSGMKAGFKAILNLEHPFARRKMDTQKGSSKLSATLLALILGASVFMAGQVWAGKYVTDPSTGKVVSAPEYGGTLSFAKAGEPPNPDYMVSAHGAGAFTSGVLGRLTMADWATPRDKHDFVLHNVPTYTIGNLAESWSQPDPLTY